MQFFFVFKWLEESENIRVYKEYQVVKHNYIYLAISWR